MRIFKYFVLLLLVTGIGAWAQDFRATIAGHVIDPSGSSVPGATVRAINAANNETTTATTNESGAYTIPFLRPGSYVLTVTADGFKEYRRTNITLEVGRTAGIDIKLEIGATTESVSVTAEAAMLETQTASRGGVVTRQQVTEIPLNARNPFMLGAMMPGVTFRGAAIYQRPFDNGAIAEWSVNGSRNSSTEFLLDGASNNSQMGGNNIAYVPIVDAVQEFNMMMNTYQAEYGHTGGGIMNVVLKSGTNAFHATGWEFLRRTPLDAARFQNNAQGQKRGEHYTDQYGFQFEGPIYLPKLLKKDSPVKLFYVGSYEGYREGLPMPLILSYPEKEMREGDFSKLTSATGQPITIYDPFNSTPDANGNPIRSPFPNNKIPGSRIDPVAARFSKFMPMPNQPTPASTRYSMSNFVDGSRYATDKFYNLVLKFDWNFGDKHRAFIRHASNDRTEMRSTNAVDGPGADGPRPLQRINDAYVIDWVGTLSPTFIVNARASASRYVDKSWGVLNEDFDLKELGFPASFVDSLPTPRYFGRWEFENSYTTMGNYRGFNATNTYSLAVNATKIWGNHVIKGGFEARQINYLVQSSGNILYVRGRTQFTQRLYNQSDAVSGDTYASLLLGTPNNLYTNYPVYPWWQNWYSAPYIQDDWKITRRLTLNLGFRLDFNTPAHEKHNRQNGPFDPAAASGIVQQLDPAMIAAYPQLANLKGSMTWAGVGNTPRVVAQFNKWNWQPRVGFAYKLSDKWVMRGGVGKFYSNPNNDILKTNGFSTNNAEAIHSDDGGRTPVAGVLSNPFPNGIPTPVGSSLGSLAWAGRDFSWFDAGFRTPYVWQFSYGFQFQVSKDSTLEATYSGSRGHDMTHEKAFNIPDISVRAKCNIMEGGSPLFCDQQVPNPFKGVEAFRGQGFYTANTLSWFQMQRPFPQFNGNMTQQGRNDSWMKYNSLQVVYNLRLRGGLNLLGNYTFSKSMEGWGFNDPYSNDLQSGLYYNDRPHVFKLTAVYELPFGKGKTFGSSASGFWGKLISGWEATAFYNNSSGEPAEMPDGSIIQLKDPKTPGGGWDGKQHWKDYQIRGWNPCVLRQYNDGSVRPQQYSLDMGCGTDFNNYAWLVPAGYAPSRSTPTRSGQIRKHHAFTMDASLNKMTQITERLRVQFRAEAFNVMNHNYFGRTTYNKDPNNANFGTMFPSTAGTDNIMPRFIQLGIKIFW